MKRYFVECIGTFFLALAVYLTGYPIAIGLMLSAMIYFGGHISGGHFNPALSLAMFFRQRLSREHLIGYMIAQTVGAFIAAELFYNVFQTPLMIPIQPEFLACLINEILPTFVLTAVFLEVLTCNRFKVAELGGLIIGLTLTGIAHFPGLFNPALRASALLSSAFHAIEPVLVGPELLYVIYPFIGAVLATIVFNHINNEGLLYKD